MIRGTQTIVTNVNILVKSPMAENIIPILEDMPFSYFKCESVSDVFMIPCFIWFFDGRVLTKDNRDVKDIDDMECFLDGWNAGMQKCPRCERYDDCIKEAAAAKVLDKGMPEYKAPAILLNADRSQHKVEGLVSLSPPMPVTEPFSSELEEWIKTTCLDWQTQVLKWAVKYQKWLAEKAEAPYQIEEIIYKAPDYEFPEKK